MMTASWFAAERLHAEYQSMTVRPPSAEVKLPHLVNKSRRAVELEARALKAALDDYASSTPAPGCQHQADIASARRADRRFRKAQQHLLAAGQLQAKLMFVNAYDHLVSVGRLLGSDGAMSLYAHTTLSRSVCEAAVRHAWLLDPSISYEERITRSAAMLFANAENRLAGAREVPVHNLGASTVQNLIDNCAAEYRQVCKLLERAGMDRALDRAGKKTARIELRSPVVKVAVKLDIGPLMSSLLPDSPGWYRISSGIAHSAAWVLHDALAGTSGPDLALTPDLMEVAAAAESAISASALIIERHATYYGYDPEPRVRQSQQRREMLDVLMREQAIKQITNLPPLIPAGSLCLICRRQPCVHRNRCQPRAGGKHKWLPTPSEQPIIRSHGLE
jgi:hypothetical protein